MQLIQSMIWLLAGVGIFIVGMNFLSEALEKSAGSGMKRMLGKIVGNRFSGVGVGAGVAVGVGEGVGEGVGVGVGVVEASGVGAPKLLAATRRVG